MMQAENSLFDNLVLPKHVVKNDFLERLMVEAGELEVYITRPEILKIAIGSWSRGKLPAWERIADIYDFEYNPIWNVDGEVVHSGSHSSESEDGRSSDRTYNRNRQETLDHSGSSDSETERSETKSEETISQLAADNAEGWSNDTKTTAETETESTENTNATDRFTDNTRETIGDTDTTTDSGRSSSSGSDAWTEKRTGNIGVTMTQQMMTAEKNFWEKYDLYGYLINEFESEFCLMVY